MFILAQWAQLLSLILHVTSTSLMLSQKKISENRARAFDWVGNPERTSQGWLCPPPAQAFWGSLALIILCCWFRRLWHLCFFLLCSVLVRSWLWFISGFISEKKSSTSQASYTFLMTGKQVFYELMIFPFLLLLDFFGVLHEPLLHESPVKWP